MRHRLRLCLAGGCAALALGATQTASAHRLAPSLLEVTEVASGRARVEWKTPLWQPAGSVPRPELPAGCRVIGPSEPVRGDDSFQLRTVMDCDGRDLVGAEFSVRGLRGTDALLRVRLADGRLLRSVLRAAAPSYVVPARESPLGVWSAYLGLGWRHIAGGFDHLLFVLGLMLLIHGRRRLLLAVTAFTAGHSVTLLLAALGLVRLPPALVELGIAASIVALAVDLARGGPDSSLRRRPWLAAGLFGLLHGLGFASALARVGLPETEIPLALFAFNVGIECGQLVFVAAVLAAARLLRGLGRAPAWLARAPAYGIGTVATWWCLERLAAALW